MAVISITITASDEQVIFGIPRFITLNANISSTIFYTLDGTEPTTSSLIYVSPIELSTNETVIIVSVFATNGTDSSPIITNTYQQERGPDLRVPHSGTNAPANSVPKNDPYPFGTPPYQPGQLYLGQEEAGFTTDNPLLPETATGWDGDGYETGFTNDPLIGVPTKSQPIQYSTTDQEGISGYGIGTFPRHSITPDKVPPVQGVVGKLIDPRTLVVYQDLTQPQDPDLPPFINRANFTLEDVNRTRSGNQYFNTGLDSPGPTGSFVKAHFNPTDNTITYYYYDNSVSRWIISKIPAPPPAISNYSSSMVFKRGQEGAGFVFKWIWPKGQYLY